MRARSRGETDITTVFGTVVPGSNPGGSTDEPCVTIATWKQHSSYRKKYLRFVRRYAKQGLRHTSSAGAYATFCSAVSPKIGTSRRAQSPSKYNPFSKIRSTKTTTAPSAS